MKKKRPTLKTSSMPSNKPFRLRITYFPNNYELMDKKFEVFKNVKTIEAAKKIVSHRNEVNIQSALYSTIDENKNIAFINL